MPVGKNTLGDKVKHLSKNVGLSKVYTNHSLRATCVTTLDKAGFASRDIMAVSGHKSESSLKHYVKTSEEKKKGMSAALAKQMNQQQPNKPLPSTSSLENNQQESDLPHTTIHLKEAQQQALVSGGSTTLSNSQEQVIIQESTTSTMNISNSRKESSVQNFHFHGSVVFYNTK